MSRFGLLIDQLKTHRPFLILFAIAVFVRLWSLDNYYLDWDEANELAIAMLPLKELVRVIAIRDIHPPGSHILVHFWIRVFGSSDISVRLWFGILGLLGLWGVYLLALEVTRSKKTALYTSILTVLSPVLMHYHRLATHHGTFFTFCIFSWYFLLRFLKSMRLDAPPVIWYRNGWLWAYFFTTFWMMYVQSVGVLVVMVQAVFALLQWKQLTVAGKRLWFALGIMFAVGLLPWLWLISQPWHASHMYEMAVIHLKPDLLTLLLTPANMFWFGSDIWFLPGEELPGLFTLGLFGLVGTALLVFAALHMRKRDPAVFQAVLFTSVWPVLLIFLAAVLTDKNVYQYRAFLFAVFGVSLLVGYWLATAGVFAQRLAATVSVFLFIILMQALAWGQIIVGPFTANYAFVGPQIKPLMKERDGLMIFPGSLYLNIIRYMEPEKFGFTENELNMDPRKENVFHMVHLMDDQYFFVSGRDVLERPEVMRAFLKFMEDHPRIWVIGYLGDVQNYFRCDRLYLLRTVEGEYIQAQCPYKSYDHRIAPIGSDDWEYPNRPLIYR